jgi:hypothetical protein
MFRAGSSQARGAGFGRTFAGVPGFLAAVMYFTAQFGQKLGARRMFMIHQDYESAIRTMLEIQ